MKIGSESELDKSYGLGAENKPANIVGGKRRIIAVCNETKRKFLFGTEMEDEEGERRIIVRMVSYLALGGA